MAKTNKYYVVWKGRTRGIFSSWEECQKQIFGYPEAQYKAFATLQAAEEAFRKNYWQAVQQAKGPPQPVGNFIKESIAVDAAWNTMSGVIEYRGVDVKTGEEIFHGGPYEDGTNNLGEFLAIVHGLAWLERKSDPRPLYSDSRVAIQWVRHRQMKTKHPRSKKNERLFEVVDRALQWLLDNEYSTSILKWETAEWGENPADFGRK